MGYSTDFYGEFGVSPPLTQEQINYLNAFASTRRVKRDAAKAAALPDPIREAVGLPIGDEGAYFVGGTGFKGQGNDDSVVDGNIPPGQRHKMMSNVNLWATMEAAELLEGAQPGLWCQWVPNGDGSAIVWDEGEKFYNYIEWIEYLIKHFMGPWGRTLNGDVSWQGEESDDRGLIRITNNVVEIGRAKITYEFGNTTI